MMGLIIDLFFAALSIVIFLAKIFFMAPIVVLRKLFKGIGKLWKFVPVTCVILYLIVIVSGLATIFEFFMPYPADDHRIHLDAEKNFVIDEPAPAPEPPVLLRPFHDNADYELGMFLFGFPDGIVTKMMPKKLGTASETALVLVFIVFSLAILIVVNMILVIVGYYRLIILALVIDLIIKKIRSAKNGSGKNSAGGPQIRDKKNPGNSHEFVTIRKEQETASNKQKSETASIQQSVVVDNKTVEKRAKEARIRELQKMDEGERMARAYRQRMVRINREGNGRVQNPGVRRIEHPYALKPRKKAE